MMWKNVLPALVFILIIVLCVHNVVKTLHSLPPKTVTRTGPVTVRIQPHDESGKYTLRAISYCGEWVVTVDSPICRELVDVYQYRDAATSAAVTGCLTLGREGQ